VQHEASTEHHAPKNHIYSSPRIAMNRESHLSSPRQILHPTHIIISLLTSSLPTWCGQVIAGSHCHVRHSKIKKVPNAKVSVPSGPYHGAMRYHSLFQVVLGESDHTFRSQTLTIPQVLKILGCRTLLVPRIFEKQLHAGAADLTQPEVRPATTHPWCLSPVGGSNNAGLPTLWGLAVFAIPTHTAISKVGERWC
jgi:hypothetical protein